MMLLSTLKDIGISWRESLAVFLPKNLKVFVYILYKTIIRTIKALIFGAWPFLIAFGILLWFRPQFFAPYQRVISDTLFYFLLFAAVRSSVSRKDFFYFAKKFGYFFIPFSIISLLYNYLVRQLQPSLSQYYLKNHYFMSNIHTFMYLIVIGAIVLFSYTLFVFLSLFMLDSASLKSLIKAPWQALKILVYNFPFCLIGQIISLGCWSLFALLTLRAQPIVGKFIFYSAFTLWAIILTIFYVKRLQEQNRVYYEV